MRRLLYRIRDIWEYTVQGRAIVRQFKVQHEEHGAWSVKVKDYGRESISCPTEPSEQLRRYLQNRLSRDPALRFDNLKWEHGRLTAWRTDPTT